MTENPRLERCARLPDPLRVARSRRAPELGPRILFFSGGTALRGLCRALKLYTHNSRHLVAPFDSGGSSAVLRQAFSMLSLGDLRSRLMSLADETVRGNPSIYQLFSHRLPADASSSELRGQLEAMIAGSDEMIAAIAAPLRQIIRTYLRVFRSKMPADLDLRGASIGNLILAGGYLSNDRDIESVIFLFSKLVEVRGVVHPTCDADLHLAAELEDGSRIIGQHRLTGKTEPPIGSRVVDLSLVSSLSAPKRAEVRFPDRSASLIHSADLICYAMGSFYSSIVANLLPRGVGAAIRLARVPKIYIPSTGSDPEQLGMTLCDAVETLVSHVRRDAGAETPIDEILNLVLVDTRSEVYVTPLDLDRVRELGVQVVDLELVSEESSPDLDSGKLSDVLVSLV